MLHTLDLPNKPKVLVDTHLQRYKERNSQQKITSQTTNSLLNVFQMQHNSIVVMDRLTIKLLLCVYMIAEKRIWLTSFALSSPASMTSWITTGSQSTKNPQQASSRNPNRKKNAEEPTCDGTDVSCPLVDHRVEGVVGGLVDVGQGGQPGCGEQPLRRAALRHQAHVYPID